ncbi:MAG: amidohydrolase [Oscillospiraceae bacterium]|nr:amidohydrolase [Oscillospiraceae bacterium]
MDILIKNILAVLPDRTEVTDVCISGGRIAAIGDIPAGFKAEKTIDGTGKMLMPGLVNAHTHASMNIFRNCADDLLFNDWLFGRIMPMEDNLNGSDCYWGAAMACLEMISTGTTSYIDMYYFIDDVARATDEAGLRAVMCRGLSGDKNDPKTADAKLKEAVDVYNIWKNHERMTFMLGPHAPYTCDDGYMTQVAAAAKELGLGLHIHLSESLSEIDTIKNAYGCTPIELADRCGVLTDRTVAAHCVQLTDSDIQLLAARGVSVATNPVSNLKLANGICPVPKLMEAGVNVALGTDSAASNNALNMFRDLGVLTLIHKGINHHAQLVTAREGLKIATVNGARAMGYSDLGEISVGYRADLLIVDLDRPNLQPVNDAVAAIAYSMNGSEVETVIVDGNILMEKGEFLTLDKEKIYYEVGKVCDRLGTR